MKKRKEKTVFDLVEQISLSVKEIFCTAALLSHLSKSNVDKEEISQHLPTFEKLQKNDIENAKLASAALEKAATECPELEGVCILTKTILDFLFAERAAAIVDMKEFVKGEKS